MTNTTALGSSTDERPSNLTGMGIMTARGGAWTATAVKNNLVRLGVWPGSFLPAACAVARDAEFAGTVRLI